MTRPQQAGLSLLEVLVAVAVLSLVAALVGQTLRLTVSAAARTETAARATHDDLDTAQLLRPLVRGAFTGPVAGPGRDDVRAFWGDEAGFRFVGRPPLAAGPVGYSVVLIRTEADALTIASVPVGAAHPRSAPLPRGSPIRAGGPFAFAYRGAATADWQPSWSDRATLPRLVRIVPASGVPTVLAVGPGLTVGTGPNDG